MIPKTIHYCWFGGNPLPDLAKRCIKSWKKYCKGYDIIRWDESNFDISSAPLYVRQAYEAKKWAFVTDYVRLWAMTKYGGIYMDTDVEVVRPLDEFLVHQAFSGFENTTNIPTGIMACEKDFPLFVYLLSFYDNAAFIKPDGSYNLIDNTITITEMCEKSGLVRNNSFQIIDGFALYPTQVFCPLNTEAFISGCDETATIHWFNGSWLTEAERTNQANYVNDRIKKREHYEHKKKKQIILQIPKKILGEKMYTKIHGIFFRSKR